jgi:hypothetical protein
MTQVNLDAFRTAIDAALAVDAGWRAALAAVLRLIAEDATGWLRYPLLVPATQLKMLQKRDLFGEMLDLRREYARQFERILHAASVEGGLPDTVPAALGAQLLMGFVFNGMGAVISHSANEEEIGAIVDAAAVLLGVGPVMHAKASG